MPIVTRFQPFFTEIFTASVCSCLRCFFPFFLTTRWRQVFAAPPVRSPLSLSLSLSLSTKQKKIKENTPKKNERAMKDSVVCF